MKENSDLGRKVSIRDAFDSELLKANPRTLNTTQQHSPQTDKTDKTDRKEREKKKRKKHKDR